MEEWGMSLFEVLPKAKSYIETQNLYVKENIEHWLAL